MQREKEINSFINMLSRRLELIGRISCLVFLLKIKVLNNIPA
jgi:hypothetical protein